MSEMTAGVMRQRYVDGHPFAHDLTRIESVPSILRDLAETWLRITIVAPGSPGKTQLRACADYVSSLADMIDGALIAEAEADARRFAILCDRCDPAAPATLTNPISGEHMCADCYTHCTVVATCTACGDPDQACYPDPAGDPVCEDCRTTWTGGDL